jgi:hypothetical protein
MRKATNNDFPCGHAASSTSWKNQRCMSNKAISLDEIPGHEIWVKHIEILIKNSLSWTVECPAVAHLQANFH